MSTDNTSKTTKRRSSKDKAKALANKPRLTLGEVLRVKGVHDAACAKCLTITNAEALAHEVIKAIVDACKDGHTVTIYGIGNFSTRTHKGRKATAALPKIKAKAEEALGGPIPDGADVFISYGPQRRLTFKQSDTLGDSLNIGAAPPVITVEDTDGNVLAKA